MKNLTLIIPAKEEADSLPTVLKEVESLDCKIIVILHASDLETIAVSYTHLTLPTKQAV